MSAHWRKARKLQAKARDEGGERRSDAPAEGVPGGVPDGREGSMTCGLQQAQGFASASSGRLRPRG